MLGSPTTSGADYRCEGLAQALEGESSEWQAPEMSGLEEIEHRPNGFEIGKADAMTRILGFPQE
jgi:hypothetical protein